MSITVQERFVETKIDGRTCEDLIVVTEDFAAVIDGASDATGAVFGGRSGGRFAADVVAASIQSLSATATARTFADRVTVDLAEAVEAAHGDLGRDTRWPAACVVCLSVQRRELWRIGDCIAMVDGARHAGTKRIDDAAYGFRAAVNSALLQSGVPLAELIETDPGHVASRALIDIQQHLSNRPGLWGYGCVNGRPVPDEYLDVISLPTDVTEVVLASDGYPTLHATLAESEAALETLTMQDPASIGDLWSIGKPTRPGANAPDDRAYLRLVLD